MKIFLLICFTLSISWSFSQDYKFTIKNKEIVRQAEQANSQSWYIKLNVEMIPTPPIPLADGSFGIFVDSTFKWILVSGNVKNGNRDGCWLWFYRNGIIKKKKCYKNGIQDGEEYLQDYLGNRMRTKHFSNGLQVDEIITNSYSQRLTSMINDYFGSIQYNQFGIRITSDIWWGRHLYHEKTQYTDSGSIRKIYNYYDELMETEYVKGHVNWELSKPYNFYKGWSPDSVHVLSLNVRDSISFLEFLKRLDELPKYKNLYMLFIYIHPKFMPKIKADAEWINKLDALASLPRLNYLSFRGGIDKYPEVIFRCKRLRILGLSSLVTNIPEELGNLQYLEHLTIGSLEEPLQSIPSSVKGLYKLKTLNLSNVSMSTAGPLFTRIGSIPNLKLLNFNKYECVEDYPKEIIKLNQIEVLYLGNQHICTLRCNMNFPSIIGELPRLNFIEVCSTHELQSEILNGDIFKNDCVISAYYTCLTEGSKILLPSGIYKDVSEVKPKTFVAYMNEDVLDSTMVTEVEIYYSDETATRYQLIIRLANGMNTSVECSKSHPFMNEEYNWTAVSDLKVGEKIKIIDEEFGSITNGLIKVISRVTGESKVLYNIRTESHQYICNDGIITHNK